MLGCSASALMIACATVISLTDIGRLASFGRSKALKPVGVKRFSVVFRRSSAVGGVQLPSVGSVARSAGATATWGGGSDGVEPNGGGASPPASADTRGGGGTVVSFEREDDESSHWLMPLG